MLSRHARQYAPHLVLNTPLNPFASHVLVCRRIDVRQVRAGTAIYSHLLVDPRELFRHLVDEPVEQAYIGRVKKRRNRIVTAKSQKRPGRPGAAVAKRPLMQSPNLKPSFIGSRHLPGAFPFETDDSAA